LFALSIFCNFQVAVNPAEVSEVKFIELQELRQQMCADPNLFTEWFRDEIQLLGFFQAEADSN
jgi:isopentenyldiphosphate isomerase